MKNTTALPGFDIQVQAPLVPVGKLEHGAFALFNPEYGGTDPGPVPYGIPHIFLDLDNSGPEVAENGTGTGSGVKHTELHHRNSRQGAGFVQNIF